VTRETKTRRPDPRLALECYDIVHPRVAPKHEGLTILHLSDLHLQAPWRENPTMLALLDHVASVEVDLVALTGDIIERRGVEDEAMELLERLSQAWNVRLGAYGVFGNHDSPELVTMTKSLSRIRWLVNASTAVEGLRIFGTSEPEDLVSAFLDEPQEDTGSFRVLLAHYPTQIVPAAAFGIDLVLAGHTHGGQIRISPRFCPHTSCDLSPRTATGLIQLGSTLCCISRGLGETVVPWRFRCPRQIAMYTLRQGPLMHAGSGGIQQIRGW
jgi:predicted MPP superfamily phosphohydrolase